MAFHWDNKNPGSFGEYGSQWGFAGNNITVRGSEIIDHLPTQKPSKNMAEASLKVLRFFRKTCRLIPFIVRIHQLQTRIKPVHAKLNIAKYIREKAHVREPWLVDLLVTKGYERMFEAEQHHTYAPLLYVFLSPSNFTPGDRGYSYLEDKKWENKTKFLKEFYRGDRPAY